MSKREGTLAYKQGVVFDRSLAAFIALQQARRWAIQRARPKTSWWVAGDFYAQQHQAQAERFKLAPSVYTLND